MAAAGTRIPVGETGQPRCLGPAVPRGLAWAVVGLLAWVLTGCGTPPGVIFDPADTTHRWPAPPDDARLAYIGQLRSDTDLKPGRGGLQGLNETLFGKDPAHGMIRPIAVCTDGARRIFVADADALLVHVFNLETRAYQQWSPPKTAGGFMQPVALAYDAASGRLLVSDSLGGAIVVFDASGKYQGRLGEQWLIRPCGLVVDSAAHRLLVVDTGAHQIVVLGMTGEHLQRFGIRGSAPGQFNFPTYIAMDSRRQVYVSDSLNFRVQIFDPDLKPVRQLGRKGDMPGYFAQPKGLAIDRNDHLFVVDANFEAVQLFDAEGKVLMSFGREGHGPGEFWLPSGIDIDANGRIWIADSFNHRVQAFEQLSAGGDANGK